MIIYEPHRTSSNDGAFSQVHEYQCEVTGQNFKDELSKTKGFSSVGGWVELNINCIDNSGNGSFDPLHNIGRVQVFNELNQSVFDEVFSPGATAIRYVSLASSFTIKWQANGSVVTTRVKAKYIP